MDTLFPNIGDLALAFDAKKNRMGLKIRPESVLRKVTRVYQSLRYLSTFKLCSAKVLAKWVTLLYRLGNTNIRFQLASVRHL